MCVLCDALNPSSLCYLLSINGNQWLLETNIFTHKCLQDTFEVVNKNACNDSVGCSFLAHESHTRRVILLYTFTLSINFSSYLDMYNMVDRDNLQEENLALKKELEELSAPFNSQLSLIRELTAELEAEWRNYQHPQDDIAPTQVDSNNQPPHEDIALTPDRRSRGTSIRYNLGLRRPKMWTRRR